MDAQLPIGIVEYYAGISNIIIRWAVELFGLNASKLSGIAKYHKQPTIVNGPGSRPLVFYRFFIFG
ncbi:MAG: hypothetical protein Ct9H300mP9_7760 [Candidatus Neomarinimicrobiota bacterium]|nr:MAG: hypothetical protein Ct9H300mP9_7760 [Candidatus Neomarinimicrobiota bacterium]